MTFVLPAFGMGVVSSPTAPPVPLETFDTATLTDSSDLSSNDNLFTFTVQPSASISAGSSITLSGLTGSATTDGSVTLSGAGATIFGSAGSWTQSTGTLVLTVDTAQTLATGSDTVVIFTLTNPVSGSGVTSVNLSSTGFTTASISGLFLEAVANKYNIPDSTDQQTEATILALSPTNPSGEVTVKFGSDTYDLYIWDGSAWYIYNNDFNQIGQFVQTTNTEATILASTPEAYTIEQASDTDDLYVYDGSVWYIYSNDYTP